MKVIALSSSPRDEGFFAGSMTWPTMKMPEMTWPAGKQAPARRHRGTGANAVLLKVVQGFVGRAFQPAGHEQALWNEP